MSRVPPMILADISFRRTGRKKKKAAAGSSSGTPSSLNSVSFFPDLRLPSALTQHHSEVPLTSLSRPSQVRHLHLVSILCRDNFSPELQRVRQLSITKKTREEEEEQEGGEEEQSSHSVDVWEVFPRLSPHYLSFLKVQLRYCLSFPET